MGLPLDVGTVSLRKRLIAVPAIIMVAAILLTIAAMVHLARQRVVAERLSASNLADQLISAAVARLPADSDDPLGTLTGLVGALPDLRHVRLFVSSQPVDEPESLLASARPSHRAPGWFLHLLRPPAWARRHEIRYHGQRIGYVLVVANPEDEIAELWDEQRLIAGLLAVLGAVFIGLMAWSVGKALQPLRFLIGRLISLQEEERRLLAHELHDELGPCLFGIKAQAACISRQTGGTGAESHAQAILSLVDDLQSLNRHILDRLRPVALQDLGLAAAVAQLVEDWRRRKPEVDWQFHAAPLVAEPDEFAALTIYRVIQECLTNAARHSRARQVKVEIGPDRAAPGIRFSVEDDGGGFDPADRRGFGLLGMDERIRGQGGRITVTSAAGRGTRVEASVPLAATAQGEAA